jgi:hypothetical protein
MEEANAILDEEKMLRKFMHCEIFQMAKLMIIKHTVNDEDGQV